MKDKQKAEQLRIAAEIYETGCEWEWRGYDGNWSQSLTDALTETAPEAYISNGFNIRIKPQPDPYAEAKQWLKEDGKVDFREDEKDEWSWISQPAWDSPVRCYRRHDPLREVKEHFERGGKVQNRPKGAEYEMGWLDSTNPSWSQDLDWRIAPPKKLIPWSFENHPEGVVWVKSKNEDITSHSMVCSWRGQYAWVSWHGAASYKDLLSDWTLIDGSPCGLEVEG